MIALTPEEISQLKNRLADYPEALEALQEIDDCDGDVEDAAISLALRAGQEPDSNEAWLAGFSKRYRHVICRTEFRASVGAGQLSTLINTLTEETDCPPLMAPPVAIYVYKADIAAFCHSFDNSRV